MTSRTITLGGTGFEVPMLPIRLNKVAFPLCRKLHNAGFLDRILAGNGQVDASAEEMDDLTEIAFIAAQAANPRTTREEFDNWPITPAELVDAFFLLRYQTGAWVPVDPSKVVVEEDDESGEARQEEKLQT